MEICFPGNKRVQANYKGFVVETDRPEAVGGDSSALSPFDLFLCSLGTCAGVHVLDFMQQRELPTEDAGISMKAERDPDSGLLTDVFLEIKLPASFPERYKAAVVRAAELCIIRRHMSEPPIFHVTATIG
jgi:putative redox protein